VNRNPGRPESIIARDPALLRGERETAVARYGFTHMHTLKHTQSTVYTADRGRDTRTAVCVCVREREKTQSCE